MSENTIDTVPEGSSTMPTIIAELRAPDQQPTGKDSAQLVSAAGDHRPR
jgi:hypothetical protein